MDSGDAVQLTVLAVLLLLSAFFSSAETAVTTVSKIRIKSLADEGNRRACTLIKIMEKPEKMISTILVGDTLVNVSAACLAAFMALKHFERGGLLLAIGGMSLLILLFGEVAPKTLGTIRAEGLALAYSPLIWFVMRLLTPLVFLVSRLSSLFLRPFREKLPKNSSLTEEELRTMVDVGHEEGVIESEERQMINNIFDFGASQAKDIMVPRVDMVSVSLDDSYETIAGLFRSEKFSRLPVYENDKDNIVGVINIKDFLFVEDTRNFQVSSLMYKPYFTYEYKKTLELLMEMREKSASLTVVLDEYGAAVGMITLEDLLEELVGEIRDEYDEDEKDLIRSVSDREYLIEGSVKLGDVNDALGLDLESEDYDSLGGYIIGLLDHLPVPGEEVKTREGLTLRVEQMKKNRIGKVRLSISRTSSQEVSDHR